MHWRTPLDIVIRQERLARGPSAPFATGHRGGSSPTRRRNPLYAAADPPASGRCPTARGPSVRPRRLGRSPRSAQCVQHSSEKKDKGVAYGRARYNRSRKDG